MVDCKKCKNYGNRCIPAVNGECDAFVAAKVENVDHPKHYQKPGHKECIQEMEEQFGVKAVYWFCKLNAYAHRYRAGNKDGNTAEQDEAKAVWYDQKAEEMLDKLIENSVDKQPDYDNPNSQISLSEEIMMLNLGFPTKPPKPSKKAALDYIEKNTSENCTTISLDMDFDLLEEIVKCKNEQKRAERMMWND